MCISSYVMTTNFRLYSNTSQILLLGILSGWLADCSLQWVTKQNKTDVFLTQTSKHESMPSLITTFGIRPKMNALGPLIFGRQYLVLNWCTWHWMTKILNRIHMKMCDILFCRYLNSSNIYEYMVAKITIMITHRCRLTLIFFSKLYHRLFR